MKKKNFKYLEEFNRWCNGRFLFSMNNTTFPTFDISYFVLQTIKGNSVFDYETGDEIIKYKGETTERFLKRIYGKDVRVYFHTGIESVKLIHYHVPSSYEEMCIICDLNGV